MRTVLENIQDVALEIGEPVPTSVAGGTDLTMLQLLAYMNRVGEMLTSEHDWTALTKTHILETVTFTYSATMASGSNIMTMANTSGLSTDFQVTGDGIPANTMITAVNPNVSVTLSADATKSQTVSLTFQKVLYPLPSDLHHIVDDTTFDEANRWASNTATPQGWHYLKAGWLPNTTRVVFRLMGNKIALYPPQDNGRRFTFEYQSTNYVTDNTGLEKSRFTADSDTCVYPDRLMVMGCKLKFWEIKGFDSSILNSDFQREVSKYKGQQTIASVASMSGTQDSIYLNLPTENLGLP